MKQTTMEREFHKLSLHAQKTNFDLCPIPPGFAMMPHILYICITILWQILNYKNIHGVGMTLLVVTSLEHRCNKMVNLGSSRGVLRFELDRGVPLEPQNPYPFLRVILAENGTHFEGFFLKNRSIFKKFCDFRGFRHAKPWKFGLSQKSWPMFKDFLVKNRTHV